MMNLQLLRGREIDEINSDHEGLHILTDDNQVYLLKVDENRNIYLESITPYDIKE